MAAGPSRAAASGRLGRPGWVPGYRRASNRNGRVRDTCTSAARTGISRARPATRQSRRCHARTTRRRPPLALLGTEPGWECAASAARVRRPQQRSGSGHRQLSPGVPPEGVPPEEVAHVDRVAPDLVGPGPPEGERANRLGVPGVQRPAAAPERKDEAPPSGPATPRFAPSVAVAAVVATAMVAVSTMAVMSAVVMVAVMSRRHVVVMLVPAAAPVPRSGCVRCRAVGPIGGRPPVVGLGAGRKRGQQAQCDDGGDPAHDGFFFSRSGTLRVHGRCVEGMSARGRNRGMALVKASMASGSGTCCGTNVPQSSK